MSLQQIKYQRSWSRHEYNALPRHPVRVVSWNAKEPNVAGIIRTAEAFRIEQVTFMRKPANMAPAVGQQRWQPWNARLDWLDAVLEAKADGYTIVALEQTDNSVSLPDAVLPHRMVLVAGDEGGGVPPKALAVADMAIVIPQFGNVASLNVTMAVSIALYEWCRQHARQTIANV